MSPEVSRRATLAALGAGVASLAGCTTGTLPGSDDGVDRTVYVGAYHWGFVMADETGTERNRVVIDRGDTLRLVGFNTDAHEAVQSLPTPVREAMPDHEALEERNEARIPPPRDGNLHEALEEANEQYRDHSLAVMPSGQHTGGGMMLPPVALPHDATTPVVRRLGATRRGDYTVSCLTYCGFGHPYMEIDGGIVVREPK